MVAARDAAAFLTIFPLPCPLRAEKSAGQMVRALAWFPLVGALIGAAAGGLAWCAWQVWSQATGAWVGVAALAVLTGALHLDGFADTLDGLGAWKSREETLRIMQDSRIGVMGAVGLVLLLGLMGSLLREFAPEFWVRTLAAVCAMSRLAMVLSAQAFPYAPKKEGLGRLVTDRREPAAVVIAAVTALGLAAVALGPRRAGILLAATLAAVWVINTLVVRRLGGITGDTLGAVNELATVTLLMVLAISG